VIGPRTSVDAESKIINSVLGKDCKIGRGVVIENSIIWDNVEVKDNCRITNALIAERCVIRAGA